MINIPESVELDGNEAAYVAGAKARIAANARKTTNKRLAAEPEFARLVEFIQRKAEAGFSKFFGDMAVSLDKNGKLSPNQEAACMKIMLQEDARKAEMRARDAGSEFVGTIGKREQFTLQVTGYTMKETDWGEQHLHFMKDAAGNVVIYKGTKQIAVKGEEITVAASVKSHYEKGGVKQTYITRAKRV